MACLSERLLHLPSVFIPVLLWVFTAGESSGLRSSSPEPHPLSPSVAMVGRGWTAGRAGRVTPIPPLTCFHLRQPDRRRWKLEDAGRVADLHASFCCCTFAVAGLGGVGRLPWPVGIVMLWKTSWPLSLCERVALCAFENSQVCGPLQRKNTCAYLNKFPKDLAKVLGR